MTRKGTEFFTLLLTESYFGTMKGDMKFL